MMRKTKWLLAAGLAMSTAGCVETMDSGYGYAQPSYGYGNGYYSSGYYAPQAYYSPPTVYRETRYVPVPTPVPVPVPQRQADRDHRWDGRHDQQRHVDRQPSSPPPATTHTNTSGSHHDGNRRDAGRDRDGDGRPDRRS
jgi:hypothetical protein